MALTETKETAFTVNPNGTINVQEAQIILKDGIEVSRQFWREVLDPANPITDTDARGNLRDANVMIAMQTYWTAEVIATRQAEIAAQEV